MWRACLCVGGETTYRPRHKSSTCVCVCVCVSFYASRRQMTFCRFRAWQTSSIYREMYTKRASFMHIMSRLYTAHTTNITPHGNSRVSTRNESCSTNVQVKILFKALSTEKRDKDYFQKLAQQFRALRSTCMPNA